MTKPIINLNDVELHPRPKAFSASGEAAERFDANFGLVSRQIGAQKLGYNITSVPPGKRAFPFHNHRVNEEMFLILEGEGELRFGDTTYPVKVMDCIACPCGGEDVAHQLINTGETDLKYLAVSTTLSPEIAEYPDSQKFGLLADFPEEPRGNTKKYMYVGRESKSLDYWEGE